MAIFGKKAVQTNSREQSTQSDSLVQKILSMKNQGYNNQQIAQILTQQGYDNQQIYNSMNQAEINSNPKSQTEHMPQFQQASPISQAGPDPQPYPQMQQSPQPQQYPDFQGDHRDSVSYSQQEFSSSKDIFDQKQIDKIEELTEAIIDERWTELMNNIQKIVDWKNRSEERILTLEKSFSELKDDFKRLNLAIVGRIKEYDQNLQETLGNVKALNLVFKQILPQFSLDIKSLHRIVDDLKGTGKKPVSSKEVQKKHDESNFYDYSSYPQFEKKENPKKNTKHDESDLNDIL